MNISFEVMGARESVPHMIKLVGAWQDDHVAKTRLGLEYDPDIEFFTSDYVQNTAFVLLMKDEEEVIGCYAALIQPYRLNKKIKSAAEVFFSVHPKYQKTRATLYLLQQLEQILPQIGVKLWDLQIPLEERYEGLNKHLKKRGYLDLSTNYFKYIG